MTKFILHTADHFGKAGEKVGFLLYENNEYGLHNAIILVLYRKLFTLSTGFSTTQNQVFFCRILGNNHKLWDFKTFRSKISYK